MYEHTNLVIPSEKRLSSGEETPERQLTSPDKENYGNAQPSNLNDSNSYFITDSRPLTKHQLRAEVGGDLRDKNKTYMNLEEHSRMTENDENDSVDDLH